MKQACLDEPLPLFPPVVVVATWEDFLSKHAVGAGDSGTKSRLVPWLGRGGTVRQGLVGSRGGKEPLVLTNPTASPSIL